MIGSLKGRIEYRGNDHICVDVAGVGYIVYCSEKTLSSLPVDGEFITLFTDLVVREDLLQLFGFLTFAEKEWHRLLCSVQGVGAKGALAIQGILSVESLSRAILLSDWATIKTAPGVGPKIAQRIVNELKEKAPKVMAMGSIKSKKENQNIDVIDNMDNVMLNEELLDGKINKKENFQELQSDALSALVNLGYSQGDAASAIAQIVLEEDDYHVQDLIRNALKILAPKG
ncbi:MAG: Holliday junction branch migration protein RuvA [Rhodobacteraceae bacterium]|nr:Holliday junction branch migration protein RuvA [Paracoccaceae bacterium]RZO39255.1 MAG: Holliday junction branch migration protein RuvA [Paracoccaceae bacterium]|tara:strand:- start:2044 stop:2730 length:687 start_codon:yes stop_codon:yes gene_type:complete